MTKTNPSVNTHITDIECEVQEAILKIEETVRRKVSIRDEAEPEAVM